MNVPNSHGRPRHRWRPPLVSLLMLALSNFAGSAYAVEFDANLKAPMMKDVAALKVQAQDFSSRYKSLRESAPEQLIRNAALTREQFELRWQVESAIDARRPLDEFAALGLVSRGDGSYSIDMGEHPQWNEFHDVMARMLSSTNLETMSPDLINRGFRPQDVVTLKDYVSGHDLNEVVGAATLPVALGFGRTVRKFDTAKRPVPEALVISFFYQRSRATSEANRIWLQGVLDQLDAQRGRILLSTFLELKPSAILAPEKLSDAIALTLVEVRRPDFEARVKAEAQGVAP